MVLVVLKIERWIVFGLGVTDSFGFAPTLGKAPIENEPGTNEFILQEMGTITEKKPRRY